MVPDELGRVVSVNIGQPTIVRWHDRDVSSAIWKRPLAGRHRVAGVNVDGDDQADRRVHGGPTKSVYAYTAEAGSASQQALDLLASWTATPSSIAK